jgi:hypothetical protein
MIRRHVAQFGVMARSAARRGAPPMPGYVVTDGRLLSLTVSEWLTLLVAVMLCGSLTLLV